MKIIPYEKIEIVTPLSKDEVKQILTNHIGPRRTFKNLFTQIDESKIFEGFIEQDFFEIQRVVKGKDFFNPTEIKGKIKSGINGTRLIIEFKLGMSFTKMFLIYWILFQSIYSLVRVIKYENIFLIALSSMGIIFGIGLTIYGFNIQKTSSIEDLCVILKGKVSTIL